jgi:hypothetical protein
MHVEPDEATDYLDDGIPQGLCLYLDGSQLDNFNTWGRTDGGWAVIPVVNDTPTGRLWGRVLGIGEQGGLALLASNGSGELYAVYMALCLLATCEIIFGPPRSQIDHPHSCGWRLLQGFGDLKLR